VTKRSMLESPSATFLGRNEEASLQSEAEERNTLSADLFQRLLGNGANFKLQVTCQNFYFCWFSGFCMVSVWVLAKFSSRNGCKCN